MLAPVRGIGDLIAVAVVPLEPERFVLHNGLRVRAGIVPLEHGDRLDAQGATYWVSVGTTAVSTVYDPEQQGRDVYCVLTKARLSPGEPITICPGRPGSSCGTIYKQAAWEAMAAQPKFRCLSCRCDPRQPEWRPPLEPTRRRLDDLIQRLTQPLGVTSGTNS